MSEQAEQQKTPPTPEEQAAALSADPHAFWQEIHKQSIAGIDAIMSKMKLELTKGFVWYLTAIRNIVVFQSKELSIFRELETRMRDNSLTEEQLKETLTSLNGLREEVRKMQAVDSNPS